MTDRFPGCSNDAASRLLYERAGEAHARRIADRETVEARAKAELDRRFERYWERVSAQSAASPTWRGRATAALVGLGRRVRMMFT